jgi:hypothetical protein
MIKYIMVDFSWCMMYEVERFITEALPVRFTSSPNRLVTQYWNSIVVMNFEEIE